MRDPEHRRREYGGASAKVRPRRGGSTRSETGAALPLVTRAHALARNSIWPVFNYVPSPPLTSNFPNTAIIAVIIVPRYLRPLSRPTLPQRVTPFIAAFLVSFALLVYPGAVHPPPSYVNWTGSCYGLIAATLNYGPRVAGLDVAPLNYLPGPFTRELLADTHRCTDRFRN